MTITFFKKITPLVFFVAMLILCVGFALLLFDNVLAGGEGRGGGERGGGKPLGVTVGPLSTGQGVVRHECQPQKDGNVSSSRGSPACAGCKGGKDKDGPGGVPSGCPCGTCGRDGDFCCKCEPPPVCNDRCPNIKGCQSKVPKGYTRDTNGNCILSVPTPTASLSANPTTIDQGAATTITWSSTNANSCEGSGFGFNTNGGTSGTRIAYPPVTSPYNLTCTGPGGSVSAPTVTVTVRVPNVEITAAPTRVLLGEESTVEWEATNVSSCQVRDEAGTLVGSTTTGSHDTGPITHTKIYTITCTNSVGTEVSAHVTITLKPQFEEI